MSVLWLRKFLGLRTWHFPRVQAIFHCISLLFFIIQIQYEELSAKTLWQGKSSHGGLKWQPQTQLSNFLILNPNPGIISASASELASSKSSWTFFGWPYCCFVFVGWLLHLLIKLYNFCFIFSTDIWLRFYILLKKVGILFLYVFYYQKKKFRKDKFPFVFMLKSAEVNTKKLVKLLWNK